MKTTLLICSILLGLYSCNSNTKKHAKANKNSGPEKFDPDYVSIQKGPHQAILGCWVGDFIADEYSKNNHLDKLHDTRAITKKISLSIDSITDKNVFGHSLVSGLQRSFKGTFELVDNVYSIRVKEPGTNPYDGTFTFKIEDNLLSGLWISNKPLNISVRKFNLKKRVFEYNPHNAFEEYAQYVDESDTKTESYTEDQDGEINEFTNELYVASTPKIVEINASSTPLAKEDVENLKKVDLMIIRNSIYARHGFSFKDPNLRSFFESQEWYMPVSMDIQKDLTKVEKENIKLLLQYEKIAEQNYDSFGR